MMMEGWLAGWQAMAAVVMPHTHALQRTPHQTRAEQAIIPQDLHGMSLCLLMCCYLRPQGPITQKNHWNGTSLMQSKIITFKRASLMAPPMVLWRYHKDVV